MVKPILFNTEMVRAILDGKKTVTRRVIKPSQEIGLKISGRFPEDMIAAKNQLYLPYCEMEDNELIKAIYKPAYEVGDILYVRETWCWCPCWDCGFATEENTCYRNGEYGCYYHKATESDNEEPNVDTWHPSIHMPKEAARIWLRVTAVRVERLQEMTAQEAYKEGVRLRPEYDTKERLYIMAFADLWDATIKKSELDTYGWYANPYVWVMEFERCEKPATIREDRDVKTGTAI